MNVKQISLLSMLAAAITVPGSNALAQQTLRTWGDQGNGTYINPILNADYSDPDVIRVGEKYYMVASDFHFVGMQILESDDMVNWRIVTQVYHRFATEGTDLPGWDTNERYAGGSWAPAIRHHDGKFWIYFCTPHEGLFMTQAERPEGPWSPLHCVKAVEKWEDPCPFWDDDGQAYLGRSQHGAGPIIVHKMSADGRQLLDDGVTVYTGPVAEGTKFLKRNGYYYLSIPEGGVGTGWQTVLRAKSIYGPYEGRRVLEQGTTAVNGPHQGAIVDTPDGQWWFYHFQHNGALGRVVHLQPMYWSDDWPVIGVDIDRNGIGEPVTAWTMPQRSEKAGVRSQKYTFNSTQLDPVWQWNHNPADQAWSLTEHKGQLTLHALKSADFRHARNTLTQRVVGYWSEATVCIDCSNMAEGGHAGLACMGKTDRLLEVGGETDTAFRGRVWLRITFDMVNKQYRFSRSTDGKRFTNVGEPFFVDFGNWKGVRFAIFHYNTLRDDGYITVEEVQYDVDKPSAVIDYNIKDFGAVNDTTVLSTEGIQKAIDACSEAGGGRVVVPPGMYKTGTLVLRSHVDLHLETGATLYGSTQLEDYRPMKTDYVSLRTWDETVQLIFADGVHDVSISGHGTIDGRGSAFKKLSWNDEGITRPHLLRFIQSRDIRIEDVTLRNSGCWMQHYLACDRVQIRGIKVFNRNNYNNDALDLDGCHDVTVADVIADSDDDAITLKSTSPRLCENIVIHDCIVSSHCNAIKLGTETNGGFRNINISNCIVKPSEDQTTQFFGDPSKRGTSTISLEIVDGGVLENVHVSNIVAEGTESPIFIRLGNRARGYAKDVPVENVGTIRGVYLSNITVEGAGATGCSITGLPRHPVEDVWLTDITIRQKGGCKKVSVPNDEKEKDYPEATMWGVLPAKGFFIRHARNINFQNVTIENKQPDKRPAYVRVDVE